MKGSHPAQPGHLALATKPKVLTFSVHQTIPRGGGVALRQGLYVVQALVVDQANLELSEWALLLPSECWDLRLCCIVLVAFSRNFSDSSQEDSKLRGG